VTDFVSIAFREDSFTWLELSKNENNLDFQRAVFQKLPFFINHKSLNESKTVSHITEKLKEIIKTGNLDNKTVNLSIPGRFAIIKNLPTDETLPPEVVVNLINFEFEKLWDEPRQKYHLYLPEGNSEKESKNTLAVAIRKSVLDFYNQIFEKINLSIASITLSCFSVEELSKLFFPKATGQSLLLGWHRRGFDAIVTENEKFVSYRFQSYNNKFDPIEKITEFDLANAFSNLLFQLQKPKILDEPILEIQTIYNFGYYFKSDWLDFMRSRVQAPINLFNLDASSNLALKISDPKFSPENIYKFVEALSIAF
jgi:hypothetical protein